VFPWDSEWHGRLEQRTFESDALRAAIAAIYREIYESQMEHGTLAHGV